MLQGGWVPGFLANALSSKRLMTVMLTMTVNKSVDACQSTLNVMGWQMHCAAGNLVIVKIHVVYDQFFKENKTEGIMQALERRLTLVKTWNKSTY